MPPRLLPLSMLFLSLPLAGQSLLPWQTSWDEFLRAYQACLNDLSCQVTNFPGRDVYWHATYDGKSPGVSDPQVTYYHTRMSPVAQTMRSRDGFTVQVADPLIHVPDRPEIWDRLRLGDRIRFRARLSLTFFLANNAGTCCFFVISARGVSLVDDSGNPISDPSVPTIEPGGIVNGASLAAPIAPGSWITIKGNFPSANTRIWTGADFAGSRMPTNLDGVSVSANGRNIPIYYISPTQINALLPPDIGAAPAQFVVTTPAGSSAPVVAPIQPFAPAFFAFDPSNRRYAAAVHVTGGLVGPPGLFGSSAPTSPVLSGRRALLYATGFGTTSPPPPPGDTFPSALPLAITSNLRIILGGRPVTVEFAGLVSPGTYQFNIVVPNALPPGDQALIAEINGVRSPELFLNVGLDPSTLPPLPDLVPTVLRAPTAGVIGQRLAGTTLSVLNQGTAEARAYRTNYYFSRTPTLTPEAVDSEWFCERTAPLAAGQSFACTGEIGIPSSLTPGLWYLLASADSANAVQEIDESNNSRVADSGPITLTGGSGGASLTVSPGTLNLQFQAGQTSPSATVQVSSPNPLDFSVQVSSSGNWLSATPTAGRTPATLTVFANPAGLAAGTYTGTVRLSATGATAAVTVNLTIAASAVPAISALSPQSAFPNELISNFTITGTNLQGVTALEFSPPGGISITNLRSTATQITGQLVVAADAIASVRQVTAVAPGGRSNSLPLQILVPSPVPAITNVTLSSVLQGANALNSFKMDFLDGDRDILFRGGFGTSAQIEVDFSVSPFVYGNCADIYTGPVLHLPGQARGTINLTASFAWTSRITSQSGIPLLVRLRDAAGNQSAPVRVVVNEYYSVCRALGVRTSSTGAPERDVQIEYAPREAQAAQ